MILSQVDKDNYLKDGVIKKKLVTEEMVAPLFETFIEILNKYLRKTSLTSLTKMFPLAGMINFFTNHCLYDVDMTFMTSLGSKNVQSFFSFLLIVFQGWSIQTQI